MLKVLVRSLGDPEVQSFVAHVFSDETKKIIADIKNLPEYNHAIDTLVACGISIDKYMDLVQSFIDVSQKPTPELTGGLKKLFGEILPMIDFVALQKYLSQKMDTSTEVKNVFAEIKSEDFTKYGETLMALEGIKTISKRLGDLGVDLPAVFGVVYTFLSSSPDAKSGEASDKSVDFVETLPLEKILFVILKYIQDPEVQGVIMYVFSKEFKQIVKDVENIPEYKKVIEVIPLARICMAIVRNAIGITPSDKIKKTGGLRKTVDEILVLVDTAALEKLYIKKVETSSSFKNMVDEIKSEKFKEFGKSVMDLDEIKALTAKLKTVDVDLAWAFGIVYNFVILSTNAE